MAVRAEADGADASSTRRAHHAPEWRSIRAVTFALCWLMALVASYVLAAGYHAVDRPQPDTGTAGTAYALALTMGLVAVAAGTVALHRRPLAGVAAGIAIPLGLYLAVGLEGNYDGFFGGGDGVLLSLMIIGPIAAIVAGTVAAIVSPHRLADFASAAGIALAGLVAMAAFYHLVTLDHQAELAREAHEAPAALWFVLVWLWLARRRAATVRTV